MVKVNSTLKRKEIKAMLDGATVKGVTFKFQKEQGMSVIFDTEGADAMSKDDLKNLVKGQLKTDPLFKAIMFTVDVL